jgi:hypothetical protein
VHLPGRLGTTTLGDVLGALHRERATGTLELDEVVTGSGRVHRVHLRNGLIRSVETGARTRRVGEILRHEGLVAQRLVPVLERVVLHAVDRPCGQLLLDARVVTARGLAEALDRQQRDRLECLYRLSDARVRFRVARRPPGDAGTLPMGPGDFLHGRPRARDRGEGASGPRRRDPVRERALRTLGLTEGATSRDVQDAFRRLAGRAHPDRFPGASTEEKEALARRFSAISSAYHALIA